MSTHSQLPGLLIVFDTGVLVPGIRQTEICSRCSTCSRDLGDADTKFILRSGEFGFNPEFESHLLSWIPKCSLQWPNNEQCKTLT